jgi:hypothetical protein
MKLKQIAIRLPPELLTLADDILDARRSKARKERRWNEQHTLNRTTILREALQLGLHQMLADAAN